MRTKPSTLLTEKDRRLRRGRGSLEVKEATMENARKLRNRIESGQLCLGAGISFADPTVTESLCDILDFVWIDMEHTGLSLESVQGHIMATKGSNTAPLVRVRWNDAALIKPVLDIGAAGIIVPMVRSREDARSAVAACLYPPDGIRGFGPRRPSNYGRSFGPEFCRAANDAIIVIAQIEHIDAIRNIEGILAVPGLTGIVFGPYDLSGSMGHMADPEHPQVVQAMAAATAKARKTSVFVGMSGAADVHATKQWRDRGVQWFLLGVDYALLLKAVHETVSELRSLDSRNSKKGFA
jgi:4-hydroxy-2-oxoheptanedioate aldolase